MLEYFDDHFDMNQIFRRIASKNMQFVSVATVNNPLDINIQLNDDLNELNELMDNMVSFYSSNQASSYTLHKNQVKVGLLCVKEVEGPCWYRCCITKLLQDNRIKVQYLDFGSEAIVRIEDLKLLDRKFCSLNPVSIACQLANLTYPAKGKWAKNIFGYLLNKITGREFQFQIVGFIDNKITVNLIVKKRSQEKVQEKVISFNESIIADGFAEYSDETLNLDYLDFEDWLHQLENNSKNKRQKTI
jgi:hypothetical protein